MKVEMILAVDKKKLKKSGFDWNLNFATPVAGRPGL